MARPSVEVVHVGSACRDIAPDDPRGWRMGGGVTYAAMTTASLGLRTAAVVGVDAIATHAEELTRLEDVGVAVQRVALAEGPIYDNVEMPDGRVQTCVAVGVPLPVPAIPDDWLRAPGWSVVPVAGEVSDAWAGRVPAAAHLAVAWQGFLRTLIPGQRVTRRVPAPSAILARADLVGVSHHDVAPETPLRDLWQWLHEGADLLITQGVDGGLLLRLGADGPIGTLRYHSLATDGEVDPTGAGDTFLAALQASIVRPAIGGRPAPVPALGLDLAFAAAAGSLVVEGPGLEGVPDLPAVLARAMLAAADEIVAVEADLVGSHPVEAR